MAEVLRYGSSLPSFSEILDILSRWGERESIAPEEAGTAREELAACLEALKEKADGMSGMVRLQIQGVLDKLPPKPGDGSQDSEGEA